MVAFYVFGGRDFHIQEAFVRTFGDVMEWKSRWIAGWGAVNCGTVPIRGNADAATDCALRAFAAHQPFRVRYGLQTFDTVMAVGVAAAPNGRVYEVIFSGGTPTGTTDLFGQRVVTKRLHSSGITQENTEGTRELLWSGSQDACKLDILVAVRSAIKSRRAQTQEFTFETRGQLPK